MRVLVVGATGTQGGSVIDALLDGEYGEFEVRGLTRDATGERARALAARGVELVEGDLADPSGLARSLEGVGGVFYPSFGGDREATYGRNVVDAARGAGVTHLVVSTGGNCDDRPGIPHVDTKADVEDYLRESGVPATVLRPHTFTSNLRMQAPAIREGRFPYPLAGGAQLALVDPRDVGRLAARAFADPDRFVGETFELAGDALTLEELAAAFADVLGREVEPVRITPAAFVERLGAPDSFRRFIEWQSEPHPTDTDRLREAFDFRPATLREYLQQEWTAGIPESPTRADGATRPGARREATDRD
ncbi:NmrA/HSCARG family protein [Salinirubellus sp. GCM10025818]|uniref:NmrA/HSCARG family protein n=1 Tax=Salinirubellus TaxID=2162630 RepID=UPI0030CFC691